MLAAHLHAFETLVSVWGDQTGFKRFVDKIRTRLSDLARIGEANLADVIERVTQKLKSEVSTESLGMKDAEDN